jgi:cyclic pyranopterin phosphate synthase
MVDVGEKEVTRRIAFAEGFIEMSPEALQLAIDNSGPKGNVLSTAELAGVSGAKKTSELIPLCHPLGLDHVEVNATVDQDRSRIVVRASATVTAKTGIEMEALVAVSVGLLTVYDMLKAAGHGMEIGGIRLLKKSGGSRGDWTADDSEENGGT